MTVLWMHSSPRLTLCPIARALCITILCNNLIRHTQGNLEDMLEDCNTGISWVMRHISSRGGDPHRLYIVGQSAGGQLGALTLIAQARLALFLHMVFMSWSCLNPMEDVCVRHFEQSACLTCCPLTVVGQP